MKMKAKVLRYRLLVALLLFCGLFCGLKPVRAIDVAAMPAAASVVTSESDPVNSNRDLVLLVSSYNPDTRRMASFIKDFEERMAASEVPCDIAIETLDCKSLSDMSFWISQTNEILDRYESRPLRAVVLLGQEAWSAFTAINRCKKNVMYFCAFVSKNGIVLDSSANKSKLWRPESVDYALLYDSVPNIGGAFNKYDIDRNLRLACTLYPEAKTVAFISDNSYGGVSLQALARKEMEHHPDLNLVLIDSREGEQVSRERYAALPARSVVLLATWRVGRDGEYFTQNSLNELVGSNPRLPVFTVTSTGLGSVAVGGYIPDYENSASIIMSQLRHYYNTGHVDQMRFHVGNGSYHFDSRKLEELKIPSYNLPKGSVVEDTMAAKLTKYSQYIELLVTGVVLLLALLFFVGWLFIHTRRLKCSLEEREEELIVAREHAEESDRLKSAFLANMSHEIRTPLNAIVGFSSLMQDGEMSQEERAEYCSIVLSNSEMLLTLLNDILDISSLECGKIKFNYAEEEAVQICQHVIMTTAHTRKEGVKMIFDCPVESLMLSTDAHRLSQVLINLLTNAAKFTSEGSITLAIALHPDQNEVWFSVSDTGPGIPLDKQEKVFNRFEKLEGNMKKGTGLGLAICRQIAAIVGGRIWVDSEYTTGARFIFAHPLNITSNTPSNGEGGGISQP